MKAFNPLSREDCQLFEAVMDGDHYIRGFSNSDIRNKLVDTEHLTKFASKHSKSAKVSRIFHRFHVHGLIAKIPRSRRWRLTRLGQRLMATAIKLRKEEFPRVLCCAA